MPLEDTELGAESLAAATDQLNAIFEKLERRLKPFGVNARVMLPIADPFDQEAHRLEFGKHGGTWRLMYVTATPTDFEERTEEVPLVTAPRFVRLAAAASINELVHTIRTKAAEELQSVRAAIAAVEAALVELPEPRGEPPSVVDDFDDIPF